MSDRLTTEAAITFSHVGLRRGAHVVLDDVTFTIRCGEFVGVIGGNGAGKSTALQLALGSLAPTTGTVRVFGDDPRRKHRPIGYVPQNVELDRDLPLRARDFVGLGLDGQRWGFALPSRLRSERILAALRDVGAEALAEKPVGRLSGGEQQRLAIAQAVVGRPALLLLDEPLANLDLAGSGDIVALVSRIAREHAMTVLLVAHDVNPLLRAMDRVLYLAGGHAALGTVAEIVNEDVLSRLYDRPVDVLHVRGRIVVVGAA